MAAILSQPQWVNPSGTETTSNQSIPEELSPFMVHDTTLMYDVQDIMIHTEQRILKKSA